MVLTIGVRNHQPVSKCHRHDRQQGNRVLIRTVRIISVVAMRLDAFPLLYIGLKPDATISVVAMPLISGRRRNIS
jgi:hypothetical protein